MLKARRKRDVEGHDPSFLDHGGGAPFARGSEASTKTSIPSKTIKDPRCYRPGHEVVWSDDSKRLRISFAEQP